MLEDDFMYVIRKALRGLDLAPTDAADRAGADGRAVLGLIAGKWDESAARAIAPVLGLDADALAAHPDYEPPACAHPAITRLDLPFGEERVNAWMVDCGDGMLLIDSGYDADSLARAIGDADIRHVIITHDHRDHVGGLGWFEGRGVKIHGPGAGYAWSELRPGDRLECGSLQIHVHDLSGHAVPALGFAISGLNVPVLATGDALFAGSMGGCAGSERFALAKRTLRDVLTGMDEQALLLTGHGPPSRLVDEWRRNPFLAPMRRH
jgi:glyoxylase-like metal-dependent hydrolase (beta-lactamase superfamily II)